MFYWYTLSNAGKDLSLLHYRKLFYLTSSNQLNLDPSPLKTPIEMSKPEHTEELIDTSTPQKIESDPNIIGMKEVHVGSINV